MLDKMQKKDDNLFIFLGDFVIFGRRSINMIFFAKDKPHMSGYLVIAFYICGLVDFGFLASVKNSDLSIIIQIILIVSAVLMLAGLILLLNAWKLGGIINIIFSCAYILGIMLSSFEEKVMALLGVLNIIIALIVLLGSRKIYLK
jgi:hypothetical protein